VSKERGTFHTGKSEDAIKNTQYQCASEIVLIDPNLEPDMVSDVFKACLLFKLEV
jgi:hypothetical protein